MITLKGLDDLNRLAFALVHGDANVVQDLVFEKIEDLGEQALSELLGTTGKRIVKAVETGGLSEFERARKAWLREVTPVSFDFKKGSQPRGKWTHSQWAASRQDWLNNRWRHDWRSQPRDPATGRWIPGRLDYIPAALQYAGTRPGRTVRTYRRKRRARRAAARKLARRLMERDNE